MEMPKHLKYAEECKMTYSPGKEAEYIRCMLHWAHDYAKKRPIGVDKDVVMRATKALVRLQRQYADGVPGQQILSAAGFVAYNNSNSDGLWPWLDKYGGLPVVKKMQGRKYMIVEQFYPALRSHFSDKSVGQAGTVPVMPIFVETSGIQSALDQMQAEIIELRRKVTELEEAVEVLRLEGSDEEVIVLRTISREEAKQEISKLFQTGETLYYSDIAERLWFDLPMVVAICQELQQEREIEVDADAL
jgi:hypothetical protein